ncbi:hypothetical protein pb186bvf_019573 [Paramecium bursaria]
MKNYKQQLLHSLQKLNEQQTLQVGFSECEKLFKECDQYQMIISTLMEQVNTKQLKEQIKLFGLLAQIINKQLHGFINQISLFFIKRLREFDQQPIIQAIAESFGKIAQYSITNEQSLQQLLKPLMQHLSQFPQHALCITRIVQYIPVDLLECHSTYILQKLTSMLTQGNGKVEVLEGMAAIILSVEEQAEQLLKHIQRVFADVVIPVLPGLLQHVNWQVKKMSLDVLYSLTVLAPQKIAQAPKLREIVCNLKSDKIKKIREAAQVQYSLLNELVQEPAQTPQAQAPLKRSYSQQKQSLKLKKIISTEDKLDMAITALDQLTQLILNKGLLNMKELDPILGIINEIKDDQCDNIKTMNRSPVHSSCEFRLEKQQSLIFPEETYTNRLKQSEVCYNTLLLVKRQLKYQENSKRNKVFDRLFPKIIINDIINYVLIVNNLKFIFFQIMQFILIFSNYEFFDNKLKLYQKE